MTVSYTGDVANGSSFGCFWKILLRWKGSVYKLIWRELTAYLLLYFALNLAYRNAMNTEQRIFFEKLKVYCSKQIDSIPMSFVLGFYVSLIVKRWWDQYWLLPLPDSLALFISASIHGQDERGRILRRTIMRYAILAYIIALMRISFRVKKRFPTMQHLVDTGLMMESEKKIFDLMDLKTKVFKFWMPVVWASNLINRARQEGRIHSDHMVQSILTELSEFRRRLGRVMVFDTVSVPLVYTQVVTLAVYTYFLAALLGRQWLSPDDERISKIYPNYEFDLYFPIFLSLQFIFYVGWLKVAETLINPFGEDDDDFDVNWLIDRHIKVSYMVVDEMHEETPELLKDNYWEQKVPKELPYNAASEHFKRAEPKGSTASLKVKVKDSIYANLSAVKRQSMIPDEVYADYESVTDSPRAETRKTWIQRQLSRVESFRSTSSASSLFGRNRSNSQANNPGLPTLQGGPSGRKPSLYDRFISRRSSKDIHRNSLKYPINNNTTTSQNNSSVNKVMNGNGNLAGKEGMAPLILSHPNSRPRVPTPDVAKENPLNIMAVSPIEKYNNPSIVNSNKINSNSSNKNNNDDRGGGPAMFSNLSYGNAEMNVSPSSSNNSNNNRNPTIANAGNQGSSPPPLYETKDGHVILTPIEENDGSPYSTSSTSRSSRSSTYPSTSSIFNRKTPTPPTPDEEVRNIIARDNFEKHQRRSEGNNNNLDIMLDHEKVIDELENVLLKEEKAYMTIDEAKSSSSAGYLTTFQGGPGVKMKKNVQFRRQYALPEVDEDDSMGNSSENIVYNNKMEEEQLKNSIEEFNRLKLLLHLSGSHENKSTNTDLDDELEKEELVKYDLSAVKEDRIIDMEDDTFIQNYAYDVPSNSNVMIFHETDQNQEQIEMSLSNDIDTSSGNNDCSNEGATVKKDCEVFV